MTVHQFTGSTTNRVSVPDVLEGAQNSDDVVVLSWKGDDFVMAMSDSSVQNTLMMLELAKRQLLDTIIYGQG